MSCDKKDGNQWSVYLYYNVIIHAHQVPMT